MKNKTEPVNSLLAYFYPNEEINNLIVFTLDRNLISARLFAYFSTSMYINGLSDSDRNFCYFISSLRLTWSLRKNAEIYFRSFL